jgi:hypothetical protein
VDGAGEPRQLHLPGLLSVEAEVACTMSRRATIHENFRARRAEFSNRVSGRGDGFEFGEWEEFHGNLVLEIRRMIQAVQLLNMQIENAPPDDPRRKDRECQLNRLRGHLGSLRAFMEKGHTKNLETFFMTAARHLLPPGIFDATLVQARWLRTEANKEIGAEIAAALRGGK